MDFRMVAIELFIVVLAVALAASFTLSLLDKWGFIEWAQLHAPNEFFNRMFSCKFCLSWWMGVWLCIFVAVRTGDPRMLLIPIFATPIIRKLW